MAHVLDKPTYRQIEPKLRKDLLNAQFDLVESRARASLALINGPDGAGKGEVLNRLYEWLDAHYVSTLSFVSRRKLSANDPACGNIGGTFPRAARSVSSSASGITRLWWDAPKNASALRIFRMSS